MTARNLKNKFTSGFTLVELLIVIGLLGAIALIVIAAINPIEQANRARDTRFKADGGQLISAIDRYFAARSEFPWMSVDGSMGIEDDFGFTPANDPGVGLCDGTAVGGTPDCAVDGVLIENDELKTEFRNRDFVDYTSGVDPVSETIWIGKEGGSSSSIYACFVPLSNSEKENAITTETVWHISITDGSRSSENDPTTVCGDDWAGGNCYICIPE